jgi:small subunit ribosomal protein S4
MPFVARGRPARTCFNCSKAVSIPWPIAWVSALSRAEARQMVRHNGVLVNGKRVNIPSYSVRPGDVISCRQVPSGHLRTKAALEAAESRGFPEWIEVDVKAGKGVFKSYPAREDLPPSINEGLVVELYSR